MILKPAPADSQELYLKSLAALGIDASKHDIRFVEDDWESPTLGAWGLGWEVWLDGMEVSQFTYFQQVGGIECDPVSTELTYGLERLAMYVQGVESIFDLDYNGAEGDRRVAAELGVLLAVRDDLDQLLLRAAHVVLDDPEADREARRENGDRRPGTYDRRQGLRAQRQRPSMK